MVYGYFLIGGIRAPAWPEDCDMKTTVLFFVLFLALLLALAESTATTILPVSSLPNTSAASGEEMYSVYCASCHGRDAKGGPSAPDLSVLSKQNNGKFPLTFVKEAIRGESRVTSHGPKDMPVWGLVFRYVGSGSRMEVEVRISNLAEYIKTLQVK